MIDDSLFVQDQATGLYLPTEAQTIVHPWDDLNILNPYLQRPKIQPDLQSTLAVLSAQGPDVPKLLRTNFRRELRSAATINPSAGVVSSSGSGGTVIQVDDASLFNTGQAVAISNGPSNPVQFIQLAVLHSVDEPNNKIFTEGALQNNLVVGDIVSVLPRVATVPDQLTLGGPPDAFFANFVSQAQPTQPTVFNIASIGNVQFVVGFFDVFMHVQPQTSYSASAFIRDSNNNDIWRGYIFAEGPDPEFFPRQSATFESNPAAGSFITLVTGVAGQTVWLRRLNFMTSASGGGSYYLRDGTGKIFARITQQYAAFNPGHDLEWVPASSGSDIQLFNNNAGTNFAVGELVYSQVSTNLLKPGRVGFHKGGFLIPRGLGLNYGVDQPVPGQGILQLNIGIYLAD